MPTVLPALALAVAALALPAIADAKTVTKADSGKTVVLHAGDRLVVKLTECAPCGYAWRNGIAPDKTILKRTKSEYVNPPQTTPPTVGGPGKRVITYVARKAGTTKLRLDYIGPTGEAGDRFRLTIKVKAAR